MCNGDVLKERWKTHLKGSFVIRENQVVDSEQNNSPGVLKPGPVLRILKLF